MRAWPLPRRPEPAGFPFRSGPTCPGASFRVRFEASAYFFCSEALTNVVKHARASSAWVRGATDDRCTVEVRADGNGGARARNDASRLTGLHHRIGTLNGAMHIIDLAEGGTVLRASIPLPPDPADNAGSLP